MLGITAGRLWWVKVKITVCEVWEQKNTPVLSIFGWEIARTLEENIGLVLAACTAPVPVPLPIGNDMPSELFCWDELVNVNFRSETCFIYHTTQKSLPILRYWKEYISGFSVNKLWAIIQKQGMKNANPVSKSTAMGS